MLNQGNWKQHPVYTNYWFCDDGRVASTSTGSARIIKPISVGKYLGVAVIQRKDVNKKIYVHRAVCELFNGTPFNGAVCRHLDGNKRNNVLSNLCWGTVQENADDKQRHGTSGKGSSHPGAKLTEAIVIEIRRMVHSGLSQADVARQLGVTKYCISDIIRGKRWTHV